MRHSLLSFLILTASFFQLHAQQSTYLFGAHYNGMQALFSGLDLSSQSQNTMSVLNTTASIKQGESTYDDAHQRYFIKTASEILVIDATTGITLDSITNANKLSNMEYDSICDCLVGLNLTDSLCFFYSFDLTTKTLQIKDTIQGLGTIMYGESTYDQLHRRYYTRSDLAILEIDSNGTVSDTAFTISSFRGLEYSPITQKLYGNYWNGSLQVIAQYDLNTDSLTYLGQMVGAVGMVQGETTFDTQQGHYYAKTIYGIFMVDAQNGITITTLPITNAFGAIEFARMTPLNLTGLPEQNNMTHTLPYPNPGEGTFTFEALEPGSVLEIYNAYGALVYTLTALHNQVDVTLDNANPGVYFYSILSPRTKQQGKLILR